MIERLNCTEKSQLAARRRVLMEQKSWSRFSELRHDSVHGGAWYARRLLRPIISSYNMLVTLRGEAHMRWRLTNIIFILFINDLNVSRRFFFYISFHIYEWEASWVQLFILHRVRCFQLISQLPARLQISERKNRKNEKFVVFRFLIFGWLTFNTPRKYDQPKEFPTFTRIFFGVIRQCSSKSCVIFWLFFSWIFNFNLYLIPEINSELKYYFYYLSFM